MKKKIFVAVISLLSITALVSCSNEESQVSTAEDPLLNLNLDDFEFSTRRGGLITIPKNNPEELERGIATLIDDAGELLAYDRTIEEVTIPIVDDEENYIIMPHSTEPVASPYIGKCPGGTTQIHSCNGMSDDCKKEVERLVKESFTGLGAGSDVTVNINVSTFGLVRVCRGGKK